MSVQRVGLKGLAGLARFAYRVAPEFKRRWSEESRRKVEPRTRVPKIHEWPSTGLHATWIGHSTVLFAIDGFTILADPVFSTRIGLNFGPLTIGLKRLIEPSLSLSEIPRPDLILLSHAHMDHFDIPSLRRLENRGTAVVTAANTTDLLRVKRYGSVHELKWSEQKQIGPVSVRAFEVNHWGARMRNDVHRGYNGYLIETDRHRVLFAGDTAYTDSFAALKSAKPISLAIMPIGAYNPWIRMHCNPEQALHMANLANAEHIIPVHHRTFQLSSEPQNEPMERLLTAANSHEHRICIRDFGEEFHRS